MEYNLSEYIFISLKAGVWADMYTKRPITITSWARGYPVMTNRVYLSAASTVAPPRWGIASDRPRPLADRQGNTRKSESYMLGLVKILSQHKI